MQRKTVALDLDGTIIDYSEGWKGVDHFGPPIKEVEGMSAQEFTAEIAKFADILIHSTRLSSEFVKSPVLVTNKIREWLETHKITYHGIWDGTGKPIASAYVDDRSVEARPIASKDLPQGKSYQEALEMIKLLVNGTPNDWPKGKVEIPQMLPGNLYLNPIDPESETESDLGTLLGPVMKIKLKGVQISENVRLFTNDIEGTHRAEVEAFFGLKPRKPRVPTWVTHIVMFICGAFVMWLILR